MKKPYYLLCVLSQLIALPMLAQLDISFGKNGRASALTNMVGNGRAMLIQPDQMIVVAGDFFVSESNVGVDLARFTTKGLPDPAFGSGGTVLLPFNFRILPPFSIGIQSDSMLIVSCTFQNPDNSMFGVMIRLTKYGLIDYGFSPTGYLKLTAPYVPTCLLIQPDDKIVVGGYTSSSKPFTVVRYSKDGVLDAGYAKGGIFTTTGNAVDAIAFQSDGTVLAVGGTVNSATEAQLIHLTTKGILDMSFGTNGFTKLTVGANDGMNIGGITVIGNDYIILTGSYNPATAGDPQRLLVIELDPIGHLNPTFAGNGKLGVPFPHFIAAGFGAVGLYEGQIVAAGLVTAVGGGPNQLGLCRITANGAIDPTFGNDGTEVIGWTNSSQDLEPAAIAIQKDQRIVVAGGLGGEGIMAMRFNNPIILPPPPVVDAFAAAQTLPLASMENVVRLYPNPSSQTVNIAGLDPTTATIFRVTDAGGHQLLSGRTGSQSTYSLDIHQLPAGTYYLTLVAGNRQNTLSFIKIR